MPGSASIHNDILDLAVVGGGAAGYFAALRVSSLSPNSRIAIFESNSRPLEKVRISGGSRCNVTHHCFDPATLVQNYPRGGKELRSAFHRFQPRQLVAWFEERGVEIKSEEDGRMFPCSNDSATIIDCFENERTKFGIELHIACKVTNIEKDKTGSFELSYQSPTRETRKCRARSVLLASGNHKSGHAFASNLGHSITELAPSLFTFTVQDEKLLSLSGISVPDVDLTLVIHGKKIFSTNGPILITHWGVSGPAVLKMSAWAARELCASDYKGLLHVNWTGHLSAEVIEEELCRTRTQFPQKVLLRSPLFSLPARLWEYILRREMGEESELPWNQLGKAALRKLSSRLASFPITIDGKGQFKDEFVTCGGVLLSEVDFRTMESKCCAGLFLAGEVLDIDGITGGFNFQSAWTGGWIAGSTIAGRINAI